MNTVTAEVHIAPPAPPEKTVTLTMPIEYARTLQSLLGWHVRGDSRATYRGHTTAIYQALLRAHVDTSERRFVGPSVEAKQVAS